MENKKYMVSVLMLTYNQSRYIDDAIKGVMSQHTDFPFELVIGDDASTDDTVEKLKKWQARYSDKIRIFAYEKNKGTIQNFLSTRRQCHGKYMAICEGDDYWIYEKKLQTQVDFLEQHPDFSSCIHPVINYYEDKGTKSISNGGQKQINNIVDLSKGNFISNVSSVFRNDLFEELPEWFSSVAVYDYPLHMLNAQYGKLYFFKRPMAVYRKNSVGIWSCAGAKQYLIAMNVREILMNHFRNSNKDVYNNLLQTYNANAIAALKCYILLKDTPKIEQIKSKLLEHNPAATDEDIKKAVKMGPQSPKIKCFIKRINKLLRQSISRLFPIPHPKNI